jgi:phage terminase large subunit-like protein
VDGLPVAIPHPAAWVVLAAVALEQTKNIAHALHGLFSDRAIDDYGLELGRTLIHSRAGGRIEGVTSNARTIEGARATFTVLDESQEWLEANRGLEMAAAIRRNAAKLGSARTLELANAHRPGAGSVAEQTFLTWQAAGGDVAGLLYDSLEAPHVADLSDVDAVRAALEVARGDSVWLDVDRLVAEIQDPTTLASVSRRYYLNAAVEAEDERWMSREIWEAAARPELRIPHGAHVVVGFDGSRVGDHTAVVAVWIRPDGTRHLDLVKVWKPAPGDPVPVLEVEDEIRACFARWAVRELTADPTYWERSLQVLASEHPGRVAAFPPQQVQAMVRATEGLMQALAAGTLTHSADPDLSEHVGNAVATEGKYGRQIRKRRRGQKIDAAVASIIAYSRSLHYQHRAAQCINLADLAYGDQDPADVLAEMEREQVEFLAEVAAQ